MKLYLVRHGETQGNQERRYIGWEDLPLNEVGLRQAQCVATRLAENGVTAIFSSDLQRASQTAVAIGRPHGLVVTSHRGLREANFGAWSGLTYDEIHQVARGPLQAWLADPEHNAPPGGETLGQIRERAMSALPRQDGAVVVSHGGTLRAILAHLTGRPFWDFQLPTASLTVIRWDGATLQELELLGNTVHL